MEFLRNSYLPGELEAKQDFLDQEPFCPTIDRPEQKTNAYENAINLRGILSHRGYKHTKLGDLLLMGNLMLYQSACLLTADFTDFSPILFDRRNIIAVEHEDGTVEKYQIIEFSRQKYEHETKNPPQS